MPINPPIRVFKAPLAVAPKRPAPTVPMGKLASPAVFAPPQTGEPGGKRAPASDATTGLTERRHGVRPIPAPVAEEIDMPQAMRLWGQSCKAR